MPIPSGCHLCTAADNTVAPGTIPFLGPVIVAQGRVHGIQVANTQDPGDPVPVRIKFNNLLPTGAGGDLFLPVDETVMGSGQGPTPGAKYKQNRATIHLHGNNTVWLSDGNVHQWITPANESTPYPAGVSARNVPDMAGCASDPNAPLLPGSSGCMTFFYTNAQSARLQFYHDHAMGITRLNVYAGEAAGYVITDAVDQDMINGTNLSGVNRPRHPCSRVLPDIGIPLVIQDRTWVDPETIFAQDPTWNSGTGPRDPANWEHNRRSYSVTSGTPTSTCLPRTRGISPARMPSAAGTMVPGSIRRSPNAPMGAQWDASRPDQSRTSTMTRSTLPGNRR